MISVGSYNYNLLPEFSTPQQWTHTIVREGVIKDKLNRLHDYLQTDSSKHRHTHTLYIKGMRSETCMIKWHNLHPEFSSSTRSGI